jgi:hypothetical protein
MVETLSIMIATLLITPYGLTTRLFAIFKVIEASLSILNPNYLIAGIIITFIHAPPSTNTSHNKISIHWTLMIKSHSRSTTMTLKGAHTFGTLGVNNPFFNSFRTNGTIATNCPTAMSAFCDPTSFTIE